MKYFFDTEFRQAVHNPLVGKKHNYLELISIGIVAEDGREYYAVSKDFDINAAWNMHEPRTGQGDRNNTDPWHNKLRDFVLMPIFNELSYQEYRENCNDPEFMNVLDDRPENERLDFYIKNLLDTSEFFKSEFKRLVKKYGKTNSKIKDEIFDFVNPDLGFHCSAYNNSEFDDKESCISKHFDAHNVIDFNQHFVAQPEFYGCYADYDWFLFCSLFGVMKDKPAGFPMYCRDLKQMLDEKAESITQLQFTRLLFDSKNWKVVSELPKKVHSVDDYTLGMKIELIKTNADYPKEPGQHHSLLEARWAKDFYQFLINLENN